MALVDEIVAMSDEMKTWRRHLHAHPELGFEEEQTADFVANKLEQFGIEVFRRIGKTGVVGVLRVGNESGSVGLRADMDALPILEENGFDHCSTVPGTMHACGHDGHTAMLLGAARYLAETKRFSGQVNFIFQPAEEGIGGAQAMVQEDLFKTFPCDRIYAMHNAPGLPLGQFGATPGTVTAAGAYFDIVIDGTGAHAAYPHNGVDPVIMAAEMVIALQAIVSRNVRATDTAVLSVTQVHAGEAHNVIPTSAKLSGTVRTFSVPVMEQIEERMRQVAGGVAFAHGGTANVNFNTIFHPVVNDEEAATIAAEVCDELVGEDNVSRDLPPGTGSEDFSYMLEEVPGCYLLLGNKDATHTQPVHNPGYDFNDDSAVYGASFFARVVEKTLPMDG